MLFRDFGFSLVFLAAVAGLILALAAPECAVSRALLTIATALS